MMRVQQQDPRSARLAKTLLSWITCARRPLKVPELRHILAFDVGDTELNQEDLPEAQDATSVCAGLVSVDEGSGIVRLFHSTTQEYLRQTRERWFPDADHEITQACVTYLSFGVFERGRCSTDAEFEERMQTYQLYEYAARNWGHHARGAERVDDLVVDFLMSRAKVEASSQALARVEGSKQLAYSQKAANNVTGLHLAASFGIEQAVYLLIARHGKDPIDSDGRTPLSWAAQNGHEAVVRVLLSYGSSATSRDRFGLTPLAWARQGKHEAVVRLLLGEDVNPGPPSAETATVSRRASHQGRSPPQTAAKMRQEATVRFVIERDVGASLASAETRTLPLHTSTWRAGEAASLRLQLYHGGASAESADTEDTTPLLWATSEGHTDLVRLLLDQGAKVESADEQGRTLLSVAAAGGQDAVARLLLEKGADVQSVDYRGRTPLALAAANGHEAIVHLLLDRDAGTNIDAADNRGGTPLLRAAEGGHENVVRLLLGNGAEAELADEAGWTPLLRAAANKHGAVVRLLLDEGDHSADLKQAVQPIQRSLATELPIADGDIDICHTGAILLAASVVMPDAEPPSSVAFSPDGQSFAVSGSTIIWDAASGMVHTNLFSRLSVLALLNPTSCHRSVAFSPDGQTLVIGSRGFPVEGFDTATGKLLWTRGEVSRSYFTSVRTVVFSPNGRFLAADQAPNNIIAWSIPGYHEAVRITTDHDSSVESIAFSPDSQKLASGSGAVIKIWDVATGANLQTLLGHGSGVLSVAFSPDGRNIASGSYDRTIRIWDVSTPDALQTMLDPGIVTSVAFSPDGKTLASTSHDKTIKIWNTATWVNSRILRGHTGHVLSVAFSPDGRKLISVGSDRAVIIWQPAMGTQNW